MEHERVSGACLCGAVQFTIELPTLFCESTQHPDRVGIPLANMDAPIDRAPQFHVYFDHGADWTATSDDLPRLGREAGTEPLDRSEC